MRPRDRLRQLALAPGGFAFDPTTGQSYTLSPSSVRIIDWLKDGCGEDDLPTRLALEYGVDLHVAARDVDSFLSSLQTYHLL